ncbi:gibberellin 2-beta-dioxygenase [Tribonema minus]|uniref:Gibberellin 2-beta-dioxygenase n=1 Tax=Tribonema minus TaxID=303371 RepID=A0A835YQZ8_9STRA|nr:gibberellin 2-beta-dioxygenase [Tribonema minus]
MPPAAAEGETDTAWREAKLPVVDLASPDADRVMVQACKDYGFFVLTNHGKYSVTAVPEVLEAARAFFALPMDVKMACSDCNNSTGYLPPFHERLDPEHQSVDESKEGYHIRRDPEPGESATDPFAVPNRWPPDPAWRALMESYFATMSQLGLRVAAVLARGLGLDDDAFFARSLARPMSVLRLLRYAPEVSDVRRGVLGTGAHTDYGLLTFLAADDVPGLQVQLDGEWLAVPPVPPPAFIVNLGDMLARWTNDALRSTCHRVVNTSGLARVSVPFFLEPDFDARVAPLPQFVSADNPARYPPILSGQHSVDMYQATRTEVSPGLDALRDNGDNSGGGSNAAAAAAMPGSAA